MILNFDQDGVLADFEGGFLREWRRRYPNEFHVPLDQRVTFHIYDNYPKELRGKVREIVSEPGFILGLEPIEGSIEGLSELAEDHEIFICTSPLSSYENCVLEKFQWVEQKFGKAVTKRIILTKDKTLVRGHKLIDDRPEIEGLCTPEWEHILFDAPYNRHIKNKKRVTWKNMKEVLGLA